MAKIEMRKGINIGRVVAKVATTVIALYVGGTIMTEIGSVMNNTGSPFNAGLRLIGWTVTDTGLNGSATCCHIGTSAGGSCGSQTTAWTGGSGCITSVSGSGVLAVIGIIGIATIVLEFVNFKL